MIHLYFGDGKGKTTAAVGLATRALGSGFPVIFVQFLKGRLSGEIESLSKLGAVIFRGKSGEKFFSKMNDDEKSQTKKISVQNFEDAISLVQKNQRALLVLDEVCAAVNYGVLPQSLVESFLQNLPKELEVVLTGRNPPASFVELSDYVSEMKKIKHPFDLKIPARRGVEY